MSLYAEDVNMLEGLDDAELEAYVEKNPRIIPQFKIDVMETTNEYISAASLEVEECEPDEEVLVELRRAHDVFDREMDLPPLEKVAMIHLLQEYKDVFAWLHEDMKGLDPKFY